MEIFSLDHVVYSLLGVAFMVGMVTYVFFMLKKKLK
jgi:hypothetical protein